MKTISWLALAVLLPCQTALSQIRTPIGATQPLTAGATVAGPAGLYAQTLATGSGGGWGVELTWDIVPNATGYVVHRTVQGSGTPAVVVNVLNGRAVQLGRTRYGYTAIDPTVLPYTAYTYWVEGVMGTMGVLSAPSPTATVNAGTEIQPGGLTATVGGTKLVVVRGALSSLGAIPGSDVTWTWTPLPMAFAYEVSFTVMNASNAVAASERATVPTTGYPPRLAPFTWAVPQGQTVRFCVSAWPDPNPANLPRSATCLRTTVP